MVGPVSHELTELTNHEPVMPYPLPLGGRWAGKKDLRRRLHCVSGLFQIWVEGDPETTLPSLRVGRPSSGAGTARGAGVPRGRE